jgi:hypothetical protein
MKPLQTRLTEQAFYRLYRHSSEHNVSIQIIIESALMNYLNSFETDEEIIARDKRELNEVPPVSREDLNHG